MIMVQVTRANKPTDPKPKHTPFHATGLSSSHCQYSCRLSGRLSEVPHLQQAAGAGGQYFAVNGAVQPSNCGIVSSSCKNTTVGESIFT